VSDEARRDAAGLALASSESPKKEEAESHPSKPKPWPTLEQLILGGFTPLLSITLTRSAGILSGYHLPMAAFAAVLACAILFVSIKHASASITELYRLPPNVALLLALVFDLTIIFAELTNVIVPEAGLEFTMWCLLIGLGAASAWLNVQYLRRS